MSEVNNNANQFDVTSSSESVDLSTSTPDISAVEQPQNSATEISTTNHSTKKMDWQNVAHKLREYNRKLLKKVFKLEQDLADTENKYKVQNEKSQNSDRILAQQAKEIKEFQEQVVRLSEQLTTAQQETQSQKTLVENLSEQLRESQKQTAQLERECALLQETCNHQSYQLIAKTQQTEELSNRLTRQQRYTLQYKAALDNYLNQVKTPESEKLEITHKSAVEVKNPPIKPWSSSSKDTSISLPSTKGKTLEVKPLSHQHQSESSTAKTTEWPAPEIAKTNQTSKSKKPQSLAAVKLPRFPRK